MRAHLCQRHENAARRVPRGPFLAKALSPGKMGSDVTLCTGAALLGPLTAVRRFRASRLSCPGPGLLRGEPRHWDRFSPSLARVSPPWRLPLGPALPRRAMGGGQRGQASWGLQPLLWADVISFGACPGRAAGASCSAWTVTAPQTPRQGHGDRRLQRMPAPSRRSRLAALEDRGRRNRGARRTDGGPGLQRETGH